MSTLTISKTSLQKSEPNIYNFFKLPKFIIKFKQMKLKRFLIRYYPPGIILEYVKGNGVVETKSIDLLNLNDE